MRKLGNNCGFLLIEVFLTMFILLSLAILLYVLLNNYYTQNRNLKVVNFIIQTSNNWYEIHRADGQYFEDFERVKTLHPYCFQEAIDQGWLYYLTYNEELMAVHHEEGSIQLMIKYEIFTKEEVKLYRLQVFSNQGVLESFLPSYSCEVLEGD